MSLTNQHSDIEKEEIDRGIYSAYEQFLGLKLNDNSAIRGLLCSTTTTIADKDSTVISDLLESVRVRCINELNQLRRQEKLINARDLALLDAENKLKFLADMSHEIRTPMNAVIALTDLLLQERTSLNSEQIEHLEVIQTSGSHLLTIINDILDISKLNHDPKFKLESRRFSLRKCLKDTLNMARHQASMSQQNKVVYVLECPPDKDANIPLPQLISQLENKGILLRPLLNKKGKTVLPIIWKIDPDVPDYLLGDTMRLTQIMLNLCSNAVKFTKQGGIHIHIKRSTPTPLRTPLSQASNNRQPDKCMTFKERYDAKIETMWNQARERTGLSPTSAGGLVTSNNNAALPTASSNDSLDSANVPDYFSEKSILEISVTDTGIGIPADRLPKLFKSFSQIDISTARRYGGTGLGLAISSTLVNRMGGCLWVESEEGVGSRFALTLPMTVAPKGRNYSTDSATPLGLAGSPSSPCSTVSDSSIGITKQHYHNRKPPQTKEENLAKVNPLRILLAEDNILNQKIAISILKRLGYVDVSIANNGKEVLSLMKSSVFDVIFVSKGMCIVNGLLIIYILFRWIFICPKWMA
ncbi:MAG: histidine kinase-DNA gyrase B-and HSP90-like ATPase-domain-containing protein [Benjaminiella poitrasii]|nr:MAG: histidine kinase-DNA gyrase B-and HSP90-like ATPase-domain-containing protein [Benjaminiella poitrasii]